MVRMDADYVRVLLGLYISANASELGESGLAQQPTDCIPTPKQIWHPVGEVAVVRQPDSGNGIKADIMAESDLYAFLFGNFFAHTMDVYLDVADQILNGKFNGRSGWKR